MKWFTLRIATILSVLTFSSAFNTIFDFYQKLFVNSIRAKLDSESESDRIDSLNLKISFPNTKWCGPGNTALNYEDLGVDIDTDWCCREHDHCPLSLNPGRELFGLRNTNVVTL